MRVLVIGVGVIGSYLTHVLCVSKNDVTVLARRKRKEELEQQGLVIRHYLQRKTTEDHPRIIGDVDTKETYDAVFAVMQYQQMRSILPALAAVNAPMVCLAGNNLSAPEMERFILERTTVPKKVMFGFQPTGGRREQGQTVCVRFCSAELICGCLHSRPDAVTQAVFAKLFAGGIYQAVYQPVYQPDMDAWYKCHMAFILPICYLSYALNCDLTHAKR